MFLNTREMGSNRRELEMSGSAVADLEGLRGLKAAPPPPPPFCWAAAGAALLSSITA